MDMDHAIKIVRKQKGVGSIWFGFNYNDSIAFVVSPHSKVIFGDPEGYIMIVDPDGQVSSVKSLPISPDVEKVFVDMNPEDFGKLPI